MVAKEKKIDREPSPAPMQWLTDDEAIRQKAQRGVKAAKEFRAMSKPPQWKVKGARRIGKASAKAIHHRNRNWSREDIRSHLDSTDGNCHNRCAHDA